MVIPAYKSPNDVIKATIDKNYLIVAHMDKIFFTNIMSGLTYIDLIEDELSFRDYYYNEKMNYKSSEKETLIPSSLKPIIIIAHLYGKTIGLGSRIIAISV